MSRTDEARIELALIDALQRGRDLIPKDTGNMAYNATLLARVGNNQWEIYVSGDGKNGIAPYTPFTTEPWISPRWHGKRNPNEGWWQRFANFIAIEVAKTLGGTVEIDIKGEK